MDKFPADSCAISPLVFMFKTDSSRFLRITSLLLALEKNGVLVAIAAVSILLLAGLQHVKEKYLHKVKFTYTIREYGYLN